MRVAGSVTLKHSTASRASEMPSTRSFIVRGRPLPRAIPSPLHMWPRFVVMTIVLLVSSVAPARAATGSVAGVVRDTTGTPIAGAQITLQGSTKRYTATADVHGAFAMSAVDEGTYGLAVRAPGFAPIGNRQITVTAGAVGQIEIALTRATTNGVATLGSVTVNGSSALSRSSAPTGELNPQALASQGAWQLTDVLGQQLEA